VLAKDTEIIL